MVRSRRDRCSLVNQDTSSKLPAKGYELQTRTGSLESLL